MGPRRIRRGKRRHSPAVATGHDPASMGPRRIRRGKPSSSANISPASWRVHWGHGESAVENTNRQVTCHSASQCFNGATANPPWKTAKSGPVSQGVVQLQWGHGESAVENDDKRGANDPKGKGFNGATANPPWKTPRRDAL